MKLSLEDVQKKRAFDLRSVFGVFGYFYDRTFGDKTVPCREILDIVNRVEIPYDFQELTQLQPQLTVVMINPGSSKPLDSEYKPSRAVNVGEIAGNREMVEAIPDNAQYQIMRLMLLNGWRHGRILNLSDVREPKSGVFMKLWPQLDITHSLFSQERKDELMKHVGNPEQVLLAWSKDEALIPLAKLAENALKGFDVFGLKRGEHLYAYPSPMLQKHKEAWLNEIAHLSSSQLISTV